MKFFIDTFLADWAKTGQSNLGEDISLDVVAE